MKDKAEFRRKLHSGLVFFGMVVNFLVIGMIFYFVWTRNPNAKPPPGLKNGRYHFAGQTGPTGKSP